LGFLNKSHWDISESCPQQNSIKIHSADNTVMGSFRNEVVSSDQHSWAHQFAVLSIGWVACFHPTSHPALTNVVPQLTLFLFGCLTFDFVLGPFSFPTLITPKKFSQLPTQLATLLM
jgi:hypothetical protein